MDFKKIQQYFPLLLLVSAIILAVMAFFPAIKVDADNMITGLKTAFGGFADNITIGGNTLGKDSGFQIMNFLAFFGPAVIAIIAAVLGALGKNKGLIAIIIGMATALFFVLALVFLINIRTNTYYEFTLFGTTTKATFKEADLGWGAIVAMIFAGVGAVVSVLNAVIGILKK